MGRFSHMCAVCCSLTRLAHIGVLWRDTSWKACPPMQVIPHTACPQSGRWARESFACTRSLLRRQSRLTPADVGCSGNLASYSRRGRLGLTGQHPHKEGKMGKRRLSAEQGVGLDEPLLLPSRANGQGKGREKEGEGEGEGEEVSKRSSGRERARTRWGNQRAPPEYPVQKSERC